VILMAARQLSRPILSFLHPYRTSSLVSCFAPTQSRSYLSTPRGVWGELRDPMWQEVGLSPRPLLTRKTPAEIWAEGSIKAQEQSALHETPNAFSGRSVPVDGPEGFAQAFRQLQRILRHNVVAKTVRQQKRHEKRGVKRRRLASQTHRRKFAQLIRGKVALVQKYRTRGS